MCQCYSLITFLHDGAVGADAINGMDVAGGIEDVGGGDAAVGGGDEAVEGVVGEDFIQANSPSRPNHPLRVIP